MILLVTGVKNRPGSVGYAHLFSTDLTLSAEEVYHQYHCRFQIEFIFRDAKTHLGLNDCQSLDAKRLAFHFHMTLLCYALVRLEQSESAVFSLQRAKRECSYRHLVQEILTTFGIDVGEAKNKEILADYLARKKTAS